ncbi:unnamed protein product [Sphagnum jensenii]|jgi:hypothetical protein|uniref:Uncharacterized protein n=1 Tax=Sphagnum jensenii TaxID=128206 RepID=A0ABP0W9L0_9BRYO
MEIISACVPESTLPLLAGVGYMHHPNLQGAIASLTLQGDAHTLPVSSPNEQETQLYPFQLDVMKHLATLSVLARLWPKSLHSKSQEFQQCQC